MDTEITAEERAEWLEEAADAIRGRMKLLGATPTQAAEHLSGQRSWRPPDARIILWEALAAIEKFIDEVREPKTWPILVDDSTRKVSNGWYEGPDLDRDKYWPPVREAISEDLGPDALEKIDESSNQVIASAGMPTIQDLKTRGLVVGFVQSGKTTNFLSVIAKAADEGYRLIVVLAGMTNSLREQTQERLEKSLTSYTQKDWTVHTQPGEDFRPNKNGYKLTNDDERQLVVIKKNGPRLKKLNKWLDDVARQEGSLTAPILVIDDEADQASVNVMTSTKEKNRRSAINAQISDLLNRRRTSYIAYTATPFANILIDPNDEADLYPDNYITVLPRPEGYFGAAQLFGRDAVIGEDPAEIDDKMVDVIRDIPAHEVDDVRPPSKGIESWTPELPDSLRDALRWFLLASAARRARGQSDKHSSMLIHSSPRVLAHQHLADAVEESVNEFSQSLSAPAFKQELEEFWDRENSIQEQNSSYTNVTFEQVWSRLQEVLDEVQFIVDNGQSDQRLDYSNGPQTVIAVGGNTLSRGLTLEGLVCSYFARVSRTYDTLLQMGRWFGFRHGYEDFVRIWMTPGLAEWFKDLATVEEDLRRDLGRYSVEGKTPSEFRAKIRLHPAMQVTSAAKMRNHKKASMSFSGARAQTIVFHEKDEDFLGHNIETTRSFLAGLRETAGPGRRRSVNGSTIYSGLKNDQVLDFINQYRFIEDVEDTPHGNKWDLLMKYIEKEVENGGLHSWNVSVIGQKNDVRGTIDLGLEQPVNLVKRTRVSSSTPGRASINTLVGPKDRINDLPFDDDQWKALDNELRDLGSTDAVLIQKHAEYTGRGVGHLTIYAIDKNSAPDRPLTEEEASKVKDTGRIRKSLDAAEHVIALGVFLPESDSESTVEYICGIDEESPSGLTQEEIDEAKADQAEIEDIVSREEDADSREEEKDEA
ncbi:Z1 domain-containing protein [Corynebacterium sp. AOP12-C2-36]|uniref:Z1 domain-containing protein n=1 Tax=Corynebacterium sp. AOP12-C2-36 TaxID=3457723 RepID=UPI004033E334